MRDYKFINREKKKKKKKKGLGLSPEALKKEQPLSWKERRVCYPKAKRI